jgi:putative DNA primase/helicase
MNTENRGGRRVTLTRCSELQPMAVRWLWNGWLPLCKLTILAGSPGTGKTTLALALAAIITTGGKWPDGSQCMKKGNVLIWSGEDGICDTLMARLVANGADLDRCIIISGVVEDGIKGSMPFSVEMDGRPGKW